VSVVNDAFQRYQDEHSRIKRAAQLTEALLRRKTARARITCEVTHRAKEIGSFVTKAYHKRYADPWKKITDKAGVRIVVQHKGLLDDALQVVKDNLTLVGDPEDYRDQEDVDGEYSLQYPRLHVQVLACGDLVDNDGQPYECEIQIRTEATDLWARMSHKLLYKTGNTAVPRDVSRSLYRLIALVELYDLEVERGVKALAQHPDFTRSNRLLAEAEFLYRTFTDHQYRRDLSEDVIDVLLNTVEHETNYHNKLAQFAEHNRRKLEDAYRDYGPTSDHFLRHGRYILVSQPESLIIFERLSTAKMLLRGIWEDQLSETMLNDMAEIWSVHL
jgi:ppGpp synthetase/RelA/SpoT-type nucleotidyltranferase